MKSKIIITLKSVKKILPLLSILLLSSCNKETYIESVGYAHLETADEASVGYFVFYSVSAASQCSPITIYVDDKEVGKLTSDYTPGTSLCTVEPVEGKLIKVVASSGSHHIMARYGACDAEATISWNLEEGTCRAYYLEYNP